MKKSILHVFMFVVGLSATLSASSQQLVFVTSSNMVGIIPNPSLPGVVIGPFPVTGLGMGQNIEGIDFRPNTGELYALGYNETTQEARLYTISQTTGLATPIGSAAVMLDLEAGKVGFDFNPTVDRIRVVSSNGKNYRLHPVTGAIAATDGDLAFAAADLNAAEMPMAVSSAYTKSYIGTEATTLYNIDFNLNILTTQIPPNDGVQNTIGDLGIDIDDANPSVGFDLFFDAATQMEMGYVSANLEGSNTDNLFTINLSSGALTDLGTIGLGLNVRDMAVVINRNVPALMGVEIYALTQNNGNLISFDSENPELIRTLVPVTGITAGQATLGMDFRPATKELYVFGYNATASNYQLYTVNTATGMATPVNATPVSLMLDTALVGFDFNPTVDRIRLVGAAGENYRLNPVDGSIAATDGDLQYAAADPNSASEPFIATVAYTNSFPGSTSTTLFAYDDMLNVLTNIIPPNDGICNTLASSGLVTGMGSYTSDMDIYFDSLAYENIFFFVTNTGASTHDFLYTVSDNIFTQVGRIGFGIPVKDIAVGIGGTPFDLAIGENNPANELRVAIYPNPASGLLYIKSEELQGTTFSVVDISGRKIASQTIQHEIEQLSLEGLKGGIYFIRFETGETLRFVVK